MALAWSHPQEDFTLNCIVEVLPTSLLSIRRITYNFNLLLSVSRLRWRILHQFIGTVLKGIKSSLIINSIYLSNQLSVLWWPFDGIDGEMWACLGNIVAWIDKRTRSFSKRMNQPENHSDRSGKRARAKHILLLSRVKWAADYQRAFPSWLCDDPTRRSHCSHAFWLVRHKLTFPFGSIWFSSCLKRRIKTLINLLS